MLVVSLICLYYYTANCHVLPVIQPTYTDELIKCVSNIVTKATSFAKQKELTYVGNNPDNKLLKAIHSLNNIALVSRQPSEKLPMAHQAYLISARNDTVFTERLLLLTKESTWKPEAPYLIVIRYLERHQLQNIFDILLKHHVINVIVVNGTADAHLYTYNPFENYGCGKYYERVIEYGKCSQVIVSNSLDLYPNKFVTGLRNCTFIAAVPNWPPFSMIPEDHNDKLLLSSPLAYGVEPYLLNLISDMWGFKIDIDIDDEHGESFASVSSDMEADGALRHLQENEADIVLGGMLLIPTRAVAFDYVHDLLPYVDELRYFVKRAEVVPAWKNIYLEFDVWVWMLILLSLLSYSIIMILLLRDEDKTNVVLKLIQNLLIQGCKMDCQWVVKCVFVIWVWCAYLINSFYQSSLVSLSTRPAKEHQILREAEIFKAKLKPCFSEIMANYYIESGHSNTTYDALPGCYGVLESLNTVMNSRDRYSVCLFGLYDYNKQEFRDEYGKSRLYSLRKPYYKVIYTMYFYKGFPQLHHIRLSALQLREMGLTDKAMSDLSYNKKLKRHTKAKTYGSRFTMPWGIYVFGCTIAVFTFVVELLSKYK